jgi:membrane protein
MALIVVGGFGAALAPLVSSIVLAFGHGILFRLLGVSFAILVLFWTLIFMVKVGSSVPRKFSEISVGVLVGTLSIEVLQSVGGFLMTRELQRLDSLYGTFAIVLGLLFWIYLQAQVLLYALEIDVVRHKQLWPRSLHNELTAADHRAYRLYSSRTIYHDNDSK